MSENYHRYPPGCLHEQKQREKRDFEMAIKLQQDLEEEEMQSERRDAEIAQQLHQEQIHQLFRRCAQDNMRYSRSFQIERDEWLARRLQQVDHQHTNAENFLATPELESFSNNLPFLSSTSAVRRNRVPRNHILSLLNEMQSNQDSRSGRISFPGSFLEFTGNIDTPSLLPPMFAEADIATDYESLLRLGELITPVSRGASAEEVSVLPNHIYSTNEKEKLCNICLSDYEKGDVLKTLPRCLHSFHGQCKDRWLGINKVCPVCRETINVH